MQTITFDPLWTDVLDFLTLNLQPQEIILAPHEFIETIPGSFPYSSSHFGKISRFNWIIIHKGRLEEFRVRFLRSMTEAFTPVFANDVFVIFSNSDGVKALDLNEPHLLSFLAQIEALPIVQKTDIQPDPQSLSSVQFNDPAWDDVLDFLKIHTHPHDRCLFPEELTSLFVNSQSYRQSHSQSIDSFQWILLHKGRLSELNLSLVEELCDSGVPVLANDVFVLFSSSQNLNEISHESPHISSLLASIEDLKREALIAEKNRLTTQHLQSLNSISQDSQDPIAATRRVIKIDQQISKYDRLLSLNKRYLSIPLAWVASSPSVPFANLGDALSPIIVSALAGIPCVHESFAAPTERLASVGTIGHEFRDGIVHFWGTGVDRERNPIDPQSKTYTRPSHTEFFVHALRGPHSARTLRAQGIDAPDVYGDPVWFLPSILEPSQEKNCELGVIVHISELTELTVQATVPDNILRYQIPESLRGSIRIISTLTPPTFEGLRQKVHEITSCKRIASTSLHGLVIAETYKIPCVYFRTMGQGVAFPKLEDEQEYINHRMRDFYRGLGLESLFVYGQRRIKETQWEELIQAIDRSWSPIDWSPEAFLESFPFPLAFNPLYQTFKAHSLFEQITL